MTPVIAMKKSDQIFYLVSCVGKKRRGPARAKDLYASEWFRRARRLIEQTGRPWFILSAKFGLVAPNQAITRYNRTLNTMRVAERRAWAGNVKAQISRRIHNFDRVVVFAGKRYREFLMDYLRGRWVVEVPMRHRGIGKQLHWLGREAARERHSKRDGGTRKWRPKVK